MTDALNEQAYLYYLLCRTGYMNLMITVAADVFAYRIDSPLTEN